LANRFTKQTKAIHSKKKKKSIVGIPTKLFTSSLRRKSEVEKTREHSIGCKIRTIQAPLCGLVMLFKKNYFFLF